MNLYRKRKINGAAWLFAAAVAFAMITICSRSSPIYPFNDWVDVNCFFTVGKAMCSGKIVYRDIYEQKGILLYVIYALAYLISNTDFLGAYILEIISMTLFLMMVYDTFRQFAVQREFFLVAPVLCAVLCSTRGFYLGGSVEEFMLTAMYLPIYVMLKTYKACGSCIPDRKNMFLLGVGAACVLWSKFTLVGIYAGYVLFGAAVLIKRHEWSRLGSCALFFALGLVAASAPWLIYFGANDALEDLYEVYFYNNIFVYHTKKTLHNYLGFLTMAFLKNIFMMAFIALGVFGVLRSKVSRELKAGMFCLYFFNVFFIYAGGIGFEYYAFGMAVLAVPGAVYAGLLLKKLLCGKTAWRGAGLCGAAAAIMVISCAFAWFRSDNTFLTKYDKADMWYGKFADEILASEDHSVLNYGSLDLGIYTLTGYVPQGRFFCKLNILLDEMHEEMNASVREGKTEWVVYTQNTDFPAEYYDVVMEEQSFFSFENAPCTYYLARRK